MSDTEKCAHAPIPQDLQGLYRVVTAYVVSGEGAPISPSFAKKLIERIAKAESARDQLRVERDALDRELRQERGLKALLANGMPPTGNPDFDEVLATHPIAAMIQRGWLTGIVGFDDLPALESAICKFYEVATIKDALNPSWPGIRSLARPIPAGPKEQSNG